MNEPRINRRVAFLAGLAALVFCLATLGAVWLSGALFLLLNKNNPLRARIDSLPRYWQQHGDDPVQHKRLVVSVAAAFGLAYVGVPVLVVRASRRQRPLHGDARFATPREVIRSGLCEGRGVIIGRYKGQYLMLPHDMHVLAAAPTGSGKGTALIIPNLLHWDHSAVVLDPKGEAWRLTSGFRARYGQKVFRFAPFDERGETVRFNPLAYVREDALLRLTDLLEMSHALYVHDDKNPNGSGNFFAGNARDLFVALGLYLLETPEAEMPRTIGQMLRVAGGDGRPRREYLLSLMREREQQGRPLSYDCTAAFFRVLGAPDDTLGSIVSTFTEPLLAFADPIVDAATSANDFDLRELRRQRMTVYAVMPFQKLKAGHVLLRLFFTVALNQNVREEPAANAALRYECLFLMDEFTAPGRIDIIAEGSGYLRSYGIRLFILFQSMGQLMGEYSAHIARSIEANHRCRILFAPAEQQDAKEQSEVLGTDTVRAVSQNHTSSPSGGSHGENRSDHGRALMLAQELRMLDPEQQVILIEGQRPILCHKARYYSDPDMAGRVLPPVHVDSINPRAYMARVRQLIRPLGRDEALGPDLDLDTLAHPFTGMPELTPDATPTQIDGYVTAYFDCLPPPEDADNGVPEVSAPEAPAGAESEFPRSPQAPAEQPPAPAAQARPAKRARRPRKSARPVTAASTAAAAAPAGAGAVQADLYPEGDIDLHKLDGE
ncbi:type IV secretory system conjugative DNA transfer family protein [Azohydromonas australica]|uniref:type IV secretory system conjugative DNA transfer family protein n=1 Tax=Azohydromonas australica TaxID=364039 RepID=UPI0003FDA205|nr:type IV secretory system conjugative DNA transfer family protein [Azohydromonas australica]